MQRIFSREEINRQSKGETNYSNIIDVLLKESHSASCSAARRSTFLYFSQIRCSLRSTSLHNMQRMFSREEINRRSEDESNNPDTIKLQQCFIEEASFILSRCFRATDFLSLYVYLQNYHYSFSTNDRISLLLHSRADRSMSSFPDHTVLLLHVGLH